MLFSGLGPALVHERNRRRGCNQKRLLKAIVTDSEGNAKDIKTSGVVDSPNDLPPSPKGGESPLTLKRTSTARPPPTVLRGSTWTPPRIQTAPSEALRYGFSFPEASGRRVRAEMIRADRDFEREEQSRELTFTQRYRLAIRWICRIVAVFAQEACSLARSGEPGWLVSKTERRVEEIVRLLVFQAEDTKFVGGSKPQLASGGQVQEKVRAEIARSPEWSQYRDMLLDLLDQCRDSNPDDGQTPQNIEVATGGSSSAKATASEETPSRPKRGPKPDYGTAVRVAQIVAGVAPNGEWRSRLDDVCMELDDQQIPRPKTWKARHGFGSWYAAVASDEASRGRHIAIEAIKHQLNLAKEKPTESIP